MAQQFQRVGAAKASRLPLAGLSHGVSHKGVALHLETEDFPRTGCVFTHLYRNGAVLVARKRAYGAHASAHAVLAQMRVQHLAVLAELRSGRLDALLREAAKRAASAGQAPAQAPAQAFDPTPDEELDDALDVVFDDASEPAPASAAMPQEEPRPPASCARPISGAPSGRPRRAAAPRALPRELSCMIAVLNTQHAGQTFTIDRTPVTIGRDPSSDIVIDHHSMTRSGYVLCLDDDAQWRILDVASGQTLTVRGVRCDEGVLEQGDIFHIGRVSVLCAVLGERVGEGRRGAAREAAGPESGAAVVSQPRSRATMLPPTPAGDAPGMALVPAQILVSAYGGIMDVGAFLIDRAPVTNREYLAYLTASGAAAPPHWPGGRPPEGTEDHPVVGVSIEHARWFARFHGKRLPTSLEWEAAARGPVGWRFPWGDKWDAARCHGPEQDAGGTAPVGRYPAGASPAGCVDLLGNVWEWTEADPAGPAPEAGHAWVLGGSYAHPCVEVNREGGEHRIARAAVTAATIAGDLGFRCARDLDVGVE